MARINSNKKRENKYGINSRRTNRNITAFNLDALDLNLEKLKDVSDIEGFLKSTYKKLMLTWHSDRIKLIRTPTAADLEKGTKIIAANEFFIKQENFKKVSLVIAEYLNNNFLTPAVYPKTGTDPNVSTTSASNEYSYLAKWRPYVFKGFNETHIFNYYDVLEKSQEWEAETKITRCNPFFYVGLWQIFIRTKPNQDKTMEGFKIFFDELVNVRLGLGINRTQIGARYDTFKAIAELKLNNPVLFKIMCGLDSLFYETKIFNATRIEVMSKCFPSKDLSQENNQEFKNLESFFKLKIQKRNTIELNSLNRYTFAAGNLAFSLEKIKQGNFDLSKKSSVSMSYTSYEHLSSSLNNNNFTAPSFPNSNLSFPSAKEVNTKSNEQTPNTMPSPTATQHSTGRMSQQEFSNFNGHNANSNTATAGPAESRRASFPQYTTGSMPQPTFFAIDPHVGSNGNNQEEDNTGKKRKATAEVGSKKKYHIDPNSDLARLLLQKKHELEDKENSKNTSGVAFGMGRK